MADGAHLPDVADVADVARLACVQGTATLAAAIEELVLAPVEDDIEAALWLRDRLDAKISTALRHFEGEAWGGDGSLTLTAWLASHGRLSRADAHRQAVVAQRLAALPLTAAAWAEGRLSGGQVAAIVSHVSAEHAGLYGGHEAEMTSYLAELSVRDTTLAMRTWRLRAEALDEHGPRPERASELYLSPTWDGQRHLAGHLGAEDSAVVEAALAGAAPPPDAAALAPSAAERRAAALVEVCRWFLTHGDQATGSARSRPQVSVVVGLADLAGDGPGHLADGTALPARAVARLACDSVLHRIVMAGRSTILDYGSATRTISPALWSALVVRDSHCRHPGCDRPASWCEGHHVVHFSKGGPTCLSNLVLACSSHHHLCHDKGWQLELKADATLVLTSPFGRVITSRPPPPALHLRA
jgi:hypothetical protein